MTSTSGEDAERVNDVKGLVDISRHAQKANHLTQRPNKLRLGHQVQLWGDNAALDFIETEWRGIISYLMEVAAAKQTSAVIEMPLMGYRALNAIQVFLHKALPGCKISAPGSEITIDWTDLI